MTCQKNSALSTTTRSIATQRSPATPVISHTKMETQCLLPLRAEPTKSARTSLSTNSRTRMITSRPRWLHSFHHQGSVTLDLPYGACSVLQCRERSRASCADLTGYLSDQKGL